MNNKISVFGCGWLGEPLAISLIQKGFSVKGSTTSNAKIPMLTSKGINSFLLNLESISSSIQSFLIADVLVINIPSKDITSFKNLVSFIEKSTVQKVVFISSTSVYPNSEEIITEKSPVKECALVEIEQLFQLNPHFETTIIRFSGLIGYSRKPGNFFKNGKTIPNPEGLVNMIHQDDCISIIEQVIIQNCWNEIFNACADTHPTRRAFYTKSFLDIGLNKPFFNENDHKEIKIVSNKKLKKVLNFEFKYPDLLNSPS